MDNSEKFNLLRLPFVAIREVFAEMNPFELVNFSLVNSKTKMITKLVTRSEKKRVKVRIEIDEHPALYIVQNDSVFAYLMIPEESKSENYSTDDENFNEILKYSEDMAKELRTWADIVLEVLNCHVDSLCIYNDPYPDQYKSIIDCLRRKTESINSLSIASLNENNEIDENIIAYLLKTLKVTKELDLHVGLSKQFDMNLIPNVSERFSISPAKFITLQDLFNLKSSIIEIVGCKLIKTQDLTRFFSSWMSLESNLNLTDFTAHDFRQHDLDEIVKSIPHEVIDQEVMRKVPSRLRKINGGIDILRIDGKRATLFTDRLLSTLNMVVH